MNCSRRTTYFHYRTDFIESNSWIFPGTPQWRIQLSYLTQWRSLFYTMNCFRAQKIIILSTPRISTWGSFFNQARIVPGTQRISACKLFFYTMHCYVRKNISFGDHLCHNGLCECRSHSSPFGSDNKNEGRNRSRQQQTGRTRQKSRRSDARSGKRNEHNSLRGPRERSFDTKAACGASGLFAGMWPCSTSCSAKAPAEEQLRGKSKKRRRCPTKKTGATAEAGSEGCCSGSQSCRESGSEKKEAKSAQSCRRGEVDQRRAKGNDHGSDAHNVGRSAARNGQGDRCKSPFRRQQATLAKSSVRAFFGPWWGWQTCHLRQEVPRRSRSTSLD